MARHAEQGLAADGAIAFPRVTFLGKAMNLEIRNIYLDGVPKDQLPEDLHNFKIPIAVEIGEKGKEGSELFHFVASSPAGLANDVSNGGFKLLRGYILMSKFDLRIVRRSIENLINHARSRENWDGVLAFFNRYGVYDSEDLDRNHFP